MPRGSPKPIEWDEKENGCFEMINRCTVDGYSVITRNGKSTKVHRYIYEQLFEYIPHGKVVMHTCNNKKCINPEHLKLGTQSENAVDAIKDGLKTVIKGEKHYMTRLKEQDISNIRNSKEKKSILATRYGLGLRHIYKIMSGEVWS